MRYLYFAIFLLAAANCSAQVRQNVYFLKNDGRRVDIKDSADLIRIVREPDSGSVLYNVLEYYPKGQKKRFARSSKIDPVLSLEGQSVSYYANGKIEEVANYVHNYQVGDVYTYFPNGQQYTDIVYSDPDNSDKYAVQPAQKRYIKNCKDSTGKVMVANGNGTYVIYTNNMKKVQEQGPVKDGLMDGEWTGTDEGGKVSFTETYKAGVLASGKAVDAEGTYNYTERMIAPKYKGGTEAFGRYLTRNITYPTIDREQGIQGTVLLSFVIAKTGVVKNIKVVRGVSTRIDDEAVRVLKRSDGWLPGVYYGRQRDSQFSVPIAFSLRD